MTPLPDARVALFRLSAPHAARGSLIARLALPVLLGALAMLTLAPVARGAVTAKPSVVTANGATRIVVTLAGVARLPARKRPTAVSVKAAARIFRLARVNATTWRSAALSGPAAAAVRALGGKRIQVRVRSRSGTTTLRPVLSVPPLGGPATPPPPPAPLPPGTQPLFPPPAQKLTGAPAFEHFKSFFLNSRFTDCPNGGWPNCSVEEKYDHCPDGTWSYFRITPSQGSDINSVGSYQVTGAEANTDGSWGVEYISTLGSSGPDSFYSWTIAATGAVSGRYWAPGTSPGTDPPSQRLTGLTWVRPVNCGQKL